MRKFLISGFILLTLSSCAKSTEPITVSSAISLQEPLQKIEKLYEEENEIDIQINYGGSGKLRAQIEQGAPVDIFFSANQREMTTLLEQNLVDEESKIDLLENTVVLATPTTISIDSIDDLKDSSIEKIGTTDPDSAAIGGYTIESLNYYGFLNEVMDKFVYSTDVETIVKWIENGNVDAGFIYKTDAYDNEKIKIVKEIPKEAIEEISYPIAIVSDSENKEAAKSFIEFLQSDVSTEIFETYGFLVAK